MPTQAVAVRQTQSPSAALVSKIIADHEDVEKGKLSAVEGAIRCGERLMQAKDQTPHGKWLPWVEENLPFSAKTAQVYIDIARENPARAKDSGRPESIRAALRALAPVAREKETTPQYDDQTARMVAATQDPSPPAREPVAVPIADAEVISDLDAPAGFGASETRKWDAAVARHAFIGKCFAEAADPELTPAAAVTALADASRTARMLAVDAEGLATTLRRQMQADGKTDDDI